MEVNAEQLLFFVIYMGIFLFSLSFHEAAHAITAKWGGDHTAESMGRVTLNPISHIDPIGTLLIPALRAFTDVPLIGWAKPVPVVESNMCRLEWGVVVALAGPFSNVILAVAGILAGQAMMLLLGIEALGVYFSGDGAAYFGGALMVLDYFVVMNIGLAVFNMLPIPPLDGHWVVWHCYVKRRPHLHGYWQAYCQYGPYVLFALVLFRVLGLPLAFLVGHVSDRLYYFATFGF